MEAYKTNVIGSENVMDASIARNVERVVLLSTDKEAVKNHARYFDVILDTVSADHDYTGYLDMLTVEGKLLIVGLPSKTPEVSPFSLIAKRRIIIGSMIGGMKETQEMLDYCAEHQIVSDVEVIPIQYINDAYQRMLRSDVKYRFVIDLATL
jgi:uncharacterized zinc-type alcohol dehydrogenase-like protein